jgi:integrase
MPRQQPDKRGLNDMVIRHLKPKAVPYLVWDTVQKGLVVRVETSGSKSYKVIYSRNGRSRWYAIAAVNAIKLAEARRLAGRVMFQVAEGGDPAAERMAQRGQGTFQELAEAYVERYAKQKNRSWKQADSLVRKYLLPRWGKLKAADIGRADVKQVMARITAPQVANQTLAAASAIFSWAIREEISGVKVNPCQKVERNETKGRERVLSDAELPRFWKIFQTCPNPVQGRALMLLLLTGQRPGEVRYMRAEHIDGGWWTLPGAPCETWPGTKNGQTHRVWLPKAAQNILAEMNLGQEGYVFASPRGGPIARLERLMGGACTALGVERATPHDLRRTHGSTVTRLGFGRDIMNRIQNHREGGIADVYDRHTYEQETKAVMEHVANFLTDLIAGNSPDKIIVFFGKRA